ncbi:CDP-alcohol phosphatidyltransferase family protein, partial [Staphylococcus pseudintermedius]|uniref:CDP-alcohol phosphatidyltransferase family protein n=1 Tax=Staphylococcus pseudintermedius TaxID=283734 RepID=UPI001C93123F
SKASQPVLRMISIALCIEEGVTSWLLSWKCLQESRSGLHPKCFSRDTIAAMFFTIPTLMTWTRILAIPLIVGVFYAPFAPESRNLIAALMFIVFAATDWLDGFLARRLNQTSSFGAFLDPVADSFWCALPCWCWCICSAQTYLWR